MEKPLAGVTVIDCSRAVAGPYCAMLLADWGADVIKVEVPGPGDEARSYSPSYGDDSCYFLVANRNKRSITLNLKTPQGRALLDQLLEKADVLVENFRPRAAAALGFEYAALAARFPRLIHCSITGFGPTGPMSERPAMDALLQAYAGPMSVTGEKDRPPVRVGLAVVDMSTALFAANGIMAALAARQRTGRGQKVETSLMESILAFQCYLNACRWGTGRDPEKLGSAHAAMAPLQVFPASDGHILVMAGNQKQWLALCDVIGHPELKDDPRFVTNADRVRNKDVLHEIIGRVLATATRAEWQARLIPLDVLCSPVNTVGEALAEPQTIHRDMVVERPHPTLGSMKFTGFPVKLSETPAVFDRDPPAIGQHTQEILATLGLDEAAVAALRAGGIV